MELRWIERTEEQYPGAGFGFTQKVLQQLVRQDGALLKGRNILGSHVWQDVPTVTEGE